MPFDIGTGIFLPIALAAGFDLPLSWQFVSAGVFFSLLPDLDFAWHLVRGGNHKNAYDHRDLLHFPLLYIPIGSALISLFSPILAILFAAASLLHFIHDSVGLGWGVEWLFPFSRNHYSFFYSFTPPGKKPLPQKIIYAWPHKVLPALDKRRGDPEWVKNVYLSLHPYAIIELAVFAAAIATLAMLLRALMA